MVTTGRSIGTDGGAVNEPLVVPRLHERVVERLVQQIVDGRLAPGSALPIEPELAQRFGVSRTVVREAVRVLSAKGLVTARHGTGVWVEPPERWNYLDPQVVFAHVRAGGDDALLDELIEARRKLETDLAELAATRRTDQDTATLRAIVAEMEATLTDPERYAALDVRFHEVVVTAAHNRLLREAMRPIAAATRLGIFTTSRRPRAPQGSFPEHQAICALIEQGDAAGAGMAMDRHIAGFADTLRRLLHREIT